jgi:hypothetical protein
MILAAPGSLALAQVGGAYTPTVPQEDRHDGKTR